VHKELGAGLRTLAAAAAAVVVVGAW